jgi:hypothetical protein
MAINRESITEGVYSSDLWNRFDCHFGSYVKSPIQLRFLSSKTDLIGRALRFAIVDLLEYLTRNSTEHNENDTTVLGTEHHVYHSGHYRLSINDNNHYDCTEIKQHDDQIRLTISSLAPAIFWQLRHDIGINHVEFSRSFTQSTLKDFTNPGKSGSLMYKTGDERFILKTLREYEARLLMQILSGYHLHITKRSTLFNRYIGLYSIRLQVSLATIEVYVVIMINAFTPLLKIDEIFDLKGSTMKRKLTGNLSLENLYRLKDIDFVDLYPTGIRLPSVVYQRLKLVVTNDVKALKKLHITDFSLILGVRHLDTSEFELMQQRPSSGIAALLHLSSTIALTHMVRPLFGTISTNDDNDTPRESHNYLKPLQLIGETDNLTSYLDDDKIARLTRPIPGIINGTNQRVYLYLLIVDMLQTFDSFKYLDQTFRKLTDYHRHLQYSVISPDEYEKRINRFLFEQVFTDACNDFPWTITDVSKTVDHIDASSINSNTTVMHRAHRRRRTHSIERETSKSIAEFRF